ncbi:MAG: molybdopterin-guanine dinucleotide biosynthesis protein MobA [Euryarchaeota archaeon]|nr:molybdopterin-guanine dinucleotide biosynthesis protein MobA [Euryarchaeota archaeon]
MVAAIITAAGKNRRMKEDLIERGLPVKNKLLFEIHGKPIIILTVENVLNTGVDECVIVLGHFSDEIVPILESLGDKRVKIIKNPQIDVELSESLLNGVNNIKSDFCLCVAADQPSVSTKTMKRLINKVFDEDDVWNIVSILSREESGYLESTKGLGMPFACHSELLRKYLIDRKNNLNPILGNMIKNGVIFYGVPALDELELVNINRYDDYLKILKESNL